MRPITSTIVRSIHAPVGDVFALLTDPNRIPHWLPGCNDARSDGPLQRGASLRVRFGLRVTTFEVVDFTESATFGWLERGQRQGWKTLFQLDPVGEATAVTIRDTWTPRSFAAWLRGRFFDKRRVDHPLDEIVENLLRALFRDRPMF